MAKIILASTSPRRKELLTQILGNDFSCMESDYVENNALKIAPRILVMKHAQGKGRAVSQKLTEGIVISADTLVFIGTKVLGKPTDPESATTMLKKISGKTVSVVTGIYVNDVKKKKEYASFEMTKVKIKKLSEEEIHWYVLSGEPLDKAGAFGIQGKGAFLVEKIDGDYYNVVGLPLVGLLRLLKKVGVKITK